MSNDPHELDTHMRRISILKVRSCVACVHVSVVYKLVDVEAGR